MVLSVQDLKSLKIQLANTYFSPEAQVFYRLWTY